MRPINNHNCPNAENDTQISKFIWPSRAASISNNKSYFRETVQNPNSNITNRSDLLIKQISKARKAFKWQDTHNLVIICPRPENNLSCAIACRKFRKSVRPDALESPRAETGERNKSRQVVESVWLRSGSKKCFLLLTY